MMNQWHKLENTQKVFWIGVVLIAITSIRYIYRIFFQNFGITYETASGIIFLSQWCFHIGFIILVASIIKKQLSFLWIPLLLFIAAQANNFEVFHHYAHEFFESNYLYPYIWYAENGSVNLQYGLVYPYLIAFLVAIPLTLYKKTRSLFRVFSLSYAVVVFISTSVFHVAIIQNSLFNTTNDTLLGHADIIKSADAGQLSQICGKASFTCVDIDKLHEYANVSRFHDKAAIKGNIFLETVENTKHTDDFFWSLEEPLNLLLDDIRGSQLFLIRIDGQQFAIFNYIDFNTYTNAHKLVFGTLTTAVHVWWLLGLIYLLRFHQRRKIEFKTDEGRET